MSSTLINRLIQQQVIPKTAIQFFDKDIITNTFDRSFKITHDINVDGVDIEQLKNDNFDLQPLYLLDFWTYKLQLFMETNTSDEHSYGDIVIKMTCQTIILKLLATATKSELNKYFKRVLKYAEELFTNDIWIVHFTCEDGYRTQKSKNRSHWPSDNRINTVHFFHNHLFEYVLMNARYLDSSDNNFKSKAAKSGTI
ncbi:hypothetical protein GLOIN_2v1788329 [Rhizophagus irregularis DAOM 181602=DAOM 197198]|uniref:Uncharacterized protein n=1 Tax=Rhizophagus irregularis (strain DAOM 181602 / DAOM 197198 / MUCL 43194) TaxID=747089 RepID=A0A2P4P3X3_RHIID|nr:hypothetical protein GLOIN_2v1788329 [Rhizophagus irregularis DAOM 181602=DAOM 197198]POG60091.1 hypothetical protein GLOIN_2v1788329 [Rhizophagus irregularis DAOM 181602=DAOM 197198]|eukprot:XP_025166957.1 hypothetical protein GLOIN_2v1788329 [Rhizophagus irregularis DAOM 181602=DAOM 197198]